MAGSWTVPSNDGFSFSGTSITEVRASFVADASDASIPSQLIDYVSGMLVDVGIIFDGTTPPDTTTTTITDKDGMTIVAATVKTASGRFALDTPVPVSDGCTIAIADNTTNSAEGTIVLYLM